MPRPQLDNLDYGSPLPDDYQNVITSYMEGVLKDPYSAHYTFYPLGKYWWRDGLLFGAKKYVGYGVKAFINSKNSYGGYTGAQEYGFIIHNGVIIRMISPDELELYHNRLFK